MYTEEQNKIIRLYTILILINKYYLDNKCFDDKYINDKSYQLLSQVVKHIDTFKMLMLVCNSYVDTLIEILDNRLVNYDDIPIEIFDSHYISTDIIFLFKHNEKTQKHNTIYNIFREMKIEELISNSEEYI